jgi:sugar transferase (PEP-CTERM/EpsH1 system associated)
MTKRILFLTPQLPYPPNQGAALRNFGLINGLAGRGHQVGLLSFRESDQPALEETPLADLCSPVVAVEVSPRSKLRRLRDLIAGHADMARRLWSKAFSDSLAALLAAHGFDVVQMEGIEMAPYLPVVRQYAPSAVVVYDAHNAEYALQRRIAARDSKNVSRLWAALYSVVQARRLTRFETDTCRMVDHIFACSEADAELLGQLRHQTPITVVPNAIQVQAYQDDSLPTVELDRPALVFTGKMDFRPNIDAVLWFAEGILPLVRESVPEAHFTVVGQRPHARLDVLRDRPDVTLTGFVPDVRPYYRQADVYVAPLRMGSGTRFKLLEAMAMRCAVVSTRLGAEGIDVEHGRDMLLADKPEGFARAVVSLLNDPERRAELGANAAKVVQATYDWSAIIPRAESAYDRR